MKWCYCIRTHRRSSVEVVVVEQVSDSVIVVYSSGRAIGTTNTDTSQVHQDTSRINPGISEGNPDISEGHSGTIEGHPGTSEGHPGTSEDLPGTSEGHQYSSEGHPGTGRARTSSIFSRTGTGSSSDQGYTTNWSSEYFSDSSQIGERG